jgi:hypothetical protein
MSEPERKVIRNPALRLLLWEPPWWLWPTVLVAFAALTWAVSLALVPGPDDFVYWFGQTRFGERCAFLVATEKPCPQCGMTRSFVYAARGQLPSAFRFSPGGATLFLWISAGGLVGLVRLLRRDKVAAALPPALFAGWAVLWLVVFYSLPWALRIGGVMAPP